MAGDCPSFHDLGRAPDTCSPIQNLALRDEVGHGANRFFDRCLRIGSMTKEKIQVIDLQPLQSGVTGVKNMFAAEPVLVRFLGVFGRTKKDLTRNKPGIARPAKFPENLAHHQLGPSGSVPFGVIEKIDSAIVGLDHQGFRDVVCDLVTERDPGSEGKFADFYASFAKSAVVHR